MLKKLITVFGLVLVLGGGYYLYTSSSDGVVAVPIDSSVVAETERIIEDINQIKGYELNVNVFDDKRFRSLENTRVELPKVEVGRSDPFAPIQ